MAKTKQTTQAAAKHDTPDTGAVSFIIPNTVLTMSLPWETVEPSYTKTRNQLAKRIKMDGFRKGKVPAHLAQQYLGEEQIAEKTIQSLLPSVYPEFVRQSGKKPLGKPEFQVTEAEPGKEWTILVNIAEKPAIDLSDLEKVLKTIKTERKQDARKRAEDTKNSIGNEKPDSKSPEIDAKKNSTKKEQEEKKERETLLSFTYAKLSQHYKPQIPELLVKQEAEEQLHSLGHQLSRFNLSYADFLKQRGITEEQFMQEITMGALGRLQLTFIVDALITHLKYVPNEQEIKDGLAKESEDAQRYYAENPDSVTHFANRLAQIKLEEFLLAE